MVKKSKLLLALDAHRGRDYEAEKRKKQVKIAEKRSRLKIEKAQKANLEDAVEADGPVSKDANDVIEPTDNAFANFSEGDDQGSVGPQKTVAANGTSTPQNAEPDASASEAEAESDVPLSDLEEEDLEDAVPHQRLTIHNGPALIASRNRIAIIKHPKTPFHYHNSLVSPLPACSTSIPDANDDLTRELEFYRIARDAAVSARTLLKKEHIPFTRPHDYFAEMVKSDEHMDKVKKKMYDEAAAKKGAEEARRLRDAKKFGKAVQVAKEQERAKEKRKTLDKIKELKRKRKGQDTGKVNEDDGDLFESIDVDQGLKKKDDRPGRERDGGPTFKRQKKDHKYGYGGKKRFSKSGDAASSADMRAFSTTRMKGKTGPGSGKKRLGKSRRAGGR